MRILIYEHVTGGGLLSTGAGKLRSLQPEGEAMAAAVAADFAAVPGIEVHLMRDARLASPLLPIHLHRVGRPGDEVPTLCTLAASADWTVLIAPEMDGVLLERARSVEEAGGRLLSPSSDVIAICGNKLRAVQHLAAAGIPVSRSVEFNGGRAIPAELRHAIGCPAVLKRVDGVGSLAMQWIESGDLDVPLAAGRWMLEEYRPGLAASAAVLCGPGGHVVLPPFIQHLEERTFAYRGGSRLRDGLLVERAMDLARRVADALPRPLGYIGIDVVLGEDPSGARDAVIEVNPRLTTSWVGLRAVARDNLAAAMLATANGEPRPPELGGENISFTCDGTVTGGPHASGRERRAC